jgi:hypothetical protein
MSDESLPEDYIKIHALAPKTDYVGEIVKFVCDEEGCGEEFVSTAMFEHARANHNKGRVSADLTHAINPYLWVDEPWPFSSSERQQAP